MVYPQSTKAGTRTGLLRIFHQTGTEWGVRDNGKKIIRKMNT